MRRGSEVGGNHRPRIRLGSVVAGNTVSAQRDGRCANPQGDESDASTTIPSPTTAARASSSTGTTLSMFVVRNNNVTGNAEFRVTTVRQGRHLRHQRGVHRAPSSAGPAYGNNDFNNSGGSCGGDECLACGCLPTRDRSGSTASTRSTRAPRPAIPDLYCLGAPTLIDGGDDLVSYDLNGDAPGDFNGSSPDIGSREDGPDDCN